MYVLILAGGISGIRKKGSGLSFMLHLSFFGMLLFFAFWEFKGRYLLPLMPMYFVLSADYLKGDEDLWKRFVKLPRRR